MLNQNIYSILEAGSPAKKQTEAAGCGLGGVALAAVLMTFEISYFLAELSMAVIQNICISHVTLKRLVLPC